MTRRAHLAAALAVSLVLPVAARQAKTPAPPRVRLTPRFSPGQTLHYQVDFRTRTASRGSGAVENQQGATEIDLAVSLLVRLEVLPAMPQGGDTLRLRATYEKSSVVLRGDSYDPSAAALEAQYRKLEGRSVEFKLSANGAVEEVQGLSEILGDEKAVAAAKDWFTQFASGMTLPGEGVVAGEIWSSERKVSESPLAGTVLETQATYLRNEDCRGGVPTPNPAPDAAPEPQGSGRHCAVILTRYQMRQRGSGRDQTPESLRSRGLRSSGKWIGAGESLAYLSLETGLTVSVTQSGSEEVELTVTPANGNPPFHYAARVQTETHIALLPETAPVTP